MKRILCVIQSLGPGGAERQLSGLAVLLKQQGYIVEVCYYIKRDFYVPFLNNNNVNVVFLSNASGKIRRFFSLKHCIDSFQPDAIISYSASPSIIIGLFKFFGAKYNLIVSERSTTQFVTVRDRLRFFFYNWTDKIVPNSCSQALFIKNNFSNLSNKVRVISNFVDTKEFSPALNKKCTDNVIKIICVGRVVPAKNIPLLIEAVSKVIAEGFKAHVDWFGRDLNDDYSKRCHDTVIQYHLQDYFVFQKPTSNIKTEYHKADFFCLPSLYEGCPNVLCEAMSCGLPVVCSRVSDVPQIMEEGANGFIFDPRDVDDMAEKLKKMITLSEEERNKMAIRSREIAVSKFSTDVFIQKYLELI